MRVEVQGDNRVRFWGRVTEFHNLVFRVVTLAGVQFIMRSLIEDSRDENKLLSGHRLALH